MIGPPLPTHFGGNFRSKISRTSNCNTAETLRFAGLAFLIRAIFQNASYEIPPAYLGTLHQSQCFRQKKKVQAIPPPPLFLSFLIEHKRHLNWDSRWEVPSVTGCGCSCPVSNVMSVTVPRQTAK